MDDLKIDGITTTPGGKFGRVDVDGMCKVNGDIEAEVFDIDGMTTIYGNVSGGKLDCDGTSTIRGNVNLERIECDGVTDIEGDLRVQTALIRGAVNVKGSRAEAERIECSGILTVHGELNAELIDAQGYIKAREIVGERVIIRSHTSRVANILRFFKSDWGCFDFIEATEVDLRKVHAKVVHGHDVRIGEKCEIETLDCTGTLHVHPSATIGTITGDYRSV